MKHALICAWLQLPENRWPPDHYTLLGLPRGVADPARVEDCVHERMGGVRHYQLAHPEEVTEVMNRLAQALLFLSDTQAKAAYDSQFQSRQSADATVAESPTPPVICGEPPDGVGKTLFPVSRDSPVPENTVEQDWLASPPAKRRITELEVEGALRADASNPSAAISERDGHSSEADSPETMRASPLRTVAAVSYFGGTGVVTKSALYARIAQIRRLCLEWDQVGKYLSDPTRLLRRPSEATELIQHMNAIRELVSNTPRLIGQAGQPGYLVMALARQQLIVPTLQTLLPSQREALARDWQASQERLREERRVLKQEVHAFRKRSKWKHGYRLLAASLARNPGLLLLLLGWLALNLSMPSVLPSWENQVIVLLGLAAIRLAIWRYSVEPVRVAPSPNSRAGHERKRPIPAAPQPRSSVF